MSATHLEGNFCMVAVIQFDRGRKIVSAQRTGVHWNLVRVGALHVICRDIARSDADQILILGQDGFQVSYTREQWT